MNSPKEKTIRNKRITHQLDKAIIEDNIKRLKGGIENNKERYYFAIRLNELLADKQKDQDAFSSTVNISTGSLSYYRKGVREPGLTPLVKMADELDVSVDYLTGKSDCPRYTFEDINKKTGLSQKAIQNLYKIQHHYFELEENFDVDIEKNIKASNTYKNELNVLSKLLEDNINLLDLLDSINKYKKEKEILDSLMKSYRETKDGKIYLKIMDTIQKRKFLKYNLMETFSNIVEGISKGE